MNTIKPGMRGVAGTREYNRCNIALSTVFLTTILVASALAQGSGYIYWVDKVSFFSFTNKIRRADCGDGTIIEDLITGDSINGIALDLTNGHIYWIEYAVPGQIRRADLDGTNDLTVNIPGGVNTPFTVALDLINNHIYWTEANLEPGAGAVRRANLDGTDPVDHITIPGAWGSSIALQIGSSSNCSSGSGSGSQNIRYVPFKSQYVLLVLLALLGVWFVLRRR